MNDVDGPLHREKPRPHALGRHHAGGQRVERTGIAAAADLGLHGAGTRGRGAVELLARAAQGQVGKVCGQHGGGACRRDAGLVRSRHRVGGEKGRSDHAPGIGHQHDALQPTRESGAGPRIGKGHFHAGTWHGETAGVERQHGQGGGKGAADLDGLAHAVEALCGHAIGARDRTALRRSMIVASGWSLIASLLFYYLA